MIDSFDKVIQERAKSIQKEQEKQYNSYIKNYYLESFYFKGIKLTVTGANIKYKHEYKKDKFSIKTYSYCELELSISLINKIKLPMLDEATHLERMLIERK